MDKVAWILYGQPKVSENEALIKAAQEQAHKDVLAALGWGQIGQGMMNTARSMGGNIGRAGQSAAGAFKSAPGMMNGLQSGAKAFLGHTGGRQAAMLGGAALAGGAAGMAAGRATAPGQQPQQQMQQPQQMGMFR